MGWHYRDPMGFPALYTDILRKSFAQPDTWFLLGGFKSESAAKSEASRFRWYKWCVKSRAEEHPTLALMLADRKLRTSLDLIDGKWLLYVRSTSDIISELLRLNPDLSDLIANELSIE